MNNIMSTSVLDAASAVQERGLGFALVIGWCVRGGLTIVAAEADVIWVSLVQGGKACHSRVSHGDLSALVAGAATALSSNFLTAVDMNAHSELSGGTFIEWLDSRFRLRRTIC